MTMTMPPLSIPDAPPLRSSDLDLPRYLNCQGQHLVIPDFSSMMSSLIPFTERWNTEGCQPLQLLLAHLLVMFCREGYQGFRAYELHAQIVFVKYGIKVDKDDAHHVFTEMPSSSVVYRALADKLCSTVLDEHPCCSTPAP